MNLRKYLTNLCKVDCKNSLINTFLLPKEQHMCYPLLVGEYMLDKEFLEIVEPVLKIDEFNDTKKRKHHGITRYDHSMNVAYITYIVCKNLNLNYKDATLAAMLHDFFNNEVATENGYKRLVDHPKVALKNAQKYFNLNDMQKDIILKHMFPITITPPKYKESLLVSLIDKYSSVNERVYSSIEEIKELPIISDIIYR